MTLNKWLNSYLTASLYLLYQMDHKALTFSLNIYFCPWILGLPPPAYTPWLIFLHSHLSSFVSTLSAAWWPDSNLIHFKSSGGSPKGRLDCWCFQIQKACLSENATLLKRSWWARQPPSYQSWLYSRWYRERNTLPVPLTLPFSHHCAKYRELSQPRL